MAVKAQAQQTIIDLTDGFSVSLNQDSVSWNGGTASLGTAQSVVITPTVYKGPTALTSNYQIGTCVASDTTTGIVTCTIATDKKSVTIAVAAGAAKSGTVTIPIAITLNGDTITLNKTFAYNIAFKGTTGDTGATGPQGAAGDDAILLSITSSAGMVFKNSTGSTVLTANVYIGGVEATVSDAGAVTLNGTSFGSIKWYVGTSTTAAATAKTYTVNASAVTNMQTITAKLEG